MNNTLASARAALDPARKKLIWSKVQKLYLQSLPVYVFGLDYRAFFHTTKIGGFTPMGSGTLLMKELYWNS
jgi:ABC-type transport system substrate-binding protein